MHTKSKKTNQISNPSRNQPCYTRMKYGSYSNKEQGAYVLELDESGSRRNYTKSVREFISNII